MFCFLLLLNFAFLCFNCCSGWVARCRPSLPAQLNILKVSDFCIFAAQIANSTFCGDLTGALKCCFGRKLRQWKFNQNTAAMHDYYLDSKKQGWGDIDIGYCWCICYNMNSTSAIQMTCKPKSWSDQHTKLDYLSKEMTDNVIRERRWRNEEIEGDLWGRELTGEMQPLIVSVSLTFWTKGLPWWW